jgi:protein-disulfide isomerase
MKTLLSTGALTLALLLGGCGDKKVDANAVESGTGGPTAAAIPAPNGGDWTETVSATPEGGFVMGNPNAAVKVVEFGSMTCGHCAAFAAEGLPQLVSKYVKTGHVSLEFRNFVRDPADIAASLLARCGGETPFFTLTDQLFAAQNDWIAKLQAMTPADQQRLQNLSPQQAVGAMANQAGLVDFVRLRGIPEDKAKACLADEAALKKLVDMNAQASSKYQIAGTPSFLINDQVVPNSADWSTLEPAIRAALS